MNLVDLPGTVEYPEDLRARTHELVSRYISEHQESSLFIAVIKADSSPRKCGVMQHIEEHNAAGRTVGCFTFCDKLDTDEDFELLKGWLANTPDAPESIPLEPYGYVATMNKELRKKNATETNHHRLIRQAQKEPGWFRDEGFDTEMEEGKVTALALVNKIGTMYTTYVLSTFVPTTVARLGQEYLQCTLRREALGAVPSPGDLAPGSAQLAQLREAALATAHRLITPCFEQSVAQYAATTLAGLQQAVDAALPAAQAVGIDGVDAVLASARQAVATACTHAIAAREGGGACLDACAAAINGDTELPFALQRFPQLMARLLALCTDEAPHIAEDVLPRANALVASALRWDSPFIELGYDLEAVPAAATVTVVGRTQLLGRLLYLFTSGFVVPSSADLDAKLRRLVDTVFADNAQEREASLCRPWRPLRPLTCVCRTAAVLQSHTVVCIVGVGGVGEGLLRRGHFL